MQGRSGTGRGAQPALDEIVGVVRRSLLAVIAPPLPQTQIDEHAQLIGGGLNLDSVAVVELISHIEGNLGFQFQDEDLRPRSFASLRTLAQVVHTRLAGPPAVP